MAKAQSVDQQGSIVFWSKQPLALWMKPNDSGGLWKVGIVVEHKSDFYCIIMDENGKLQQCKTSLVRPYRGVV